MCFRPSQSFSRFYRDDLARKLKLTNEALAQVVLWADSANKARLLKEAGNKSVSAPAGPANDGSSVGSDNSPTGAAKLRGGSAGVLCGMEEILGDDGLPLTEEELISPERGLVVISVMEKAVKVLAAMHRHVPYLKLHSNYIVFLQISGV